MIGLEELSHADLMALKNDMRFQAFLYSLSQRQEALEKQVAAKVIAAEQHNAILLAGAISELALMLNIVDMFIQDTANEKDVEENGNNG